MGITVIDNGLGKEKQDVIQKLDSSKITDGERIQLETRLGEINSEQTRIVQETLNDEKKKIPKIIVEKPDIKKIKKLLKQKYQDYRQVTITARNFVDSCVEKKKDGRELMKRIVDGEEGDKIISDILKY